MNDEVWNGDIYPLNKCEEHGKKKKTTHWVVMTNNFI